MLRRLAREAGEAAFGSRLWRVCGRRRRRCDCGRRAVAAPQCSQSQTQGSRTMRNRPYPVLKCSSQTHLVPFEPRKKASCLSGAAASSYLSSQSLSDSRFNLGATSRSPPSRRALPCRFFLCRVALLCLVLRRRRRLPFPCSLGFFRLSAQLRPPCCISWPLESIELPSKYALQQCTAPLAFFPACHSTPCAASRWCSRC